jgi:hypothetical protein
MDKTRFIRCYEYEVVMNSTEAESHHDEICTQTRAYNNTVNGRTSFVPDNKKLYVQKVGYFMS